MGPDTTLAEYFGWVSHMSEITRAVFRLDDIYISSVEGYVEGLNAGVTSFVEHAHNNWSRPVMESGYQAAVDSTARVWWCYDVRHKEGFSSDEQWEAHGALSQDKSSPRVLPGLSLDGLGWTVMNGDGKAADFIREKKDKLDLQALTVHHFGGPWPRTNTSPTIVCADNNVHETNLPIILSHASFLTDSDKELLRKHNVFISIMPESECLYGQGQETGHEISDQASLGIDTNWNFSDDIVGQARLWLQLVRFRNYTKTLKNWPDTTGEPDGRRAGSPPRYKARRSCPSQRRYRCDYGRREGRPCRIQRRQPKLGWSDPIAAVVLHANSGDMEHVLVDGEWKKKDFRLVDLPTGMSWDGLRARFLESSRRMQPHFKTPPPLPEKLWGVCDLGNVDIVSTVINHPE
ncbi:hypothetical protein BDW66DRAFT_152717 [Aspergillus desertorum]